MPVNSQDFVIFSQSVTPDGDEIARRVIVSRAYYGAYHACTEWHASLPVAGHDIGFKGGAHQTLVNQLVNPDQSCTRDIELQSKGIGYALRELRDWRHEADYELHLTIDKVRAENAIEKAKLLLQRAAVGGAPPPSPPPAPQPPPLPPAPAAPTLTAQATPRPPLRRLK
ncbi:hypothetical protein [Variovorax boronicumulans]|uniref:hypothetical protein n=1 Tax=Variovorax boronicumulans TaxID=436515 RepID=UPI0012FE7952|nr:hypothetical protein [Variovorax boronicumulans]